MDIEMILESLGSALVSLLWHVFEVIIVFIIGRKLIGFLIDCLRKITKRAGLDSGVISFLISFSRILLYVILVVIIAGIFGIPTASFVALIGSCGLTVGLALQGSLQNLAGGVLILIMKPFVVGDYIIVGSNEGTVSSIDICYTKLKTGDNRVIVLPNGTLSNSDLINVSKEEYRRVDIIVPIGYKDDIVSVKEMLKKIIETEETVLADRPQKIFVNTFGDDSVEIGVRVWCKSSDYWELKWSLLEKIKYAMDENGYNIPYKQMDIHIQQ